MKWRDRIGRKGRRDSGTFTSIPHAVQDSANWQRCSGTAIKLLLTLARQYNGRNNGDLSTSNGTLARFGYRPSGAINVAKKELRHYGLIVQTRQGGLHRASLYAISWRAIDDCGGKLDLAPTRVAPGDWNQPREPFVRPTKNKAPARIPSRTATDSVKVAGKATAAATDSVVIRPQSQAPP